MRDSLVTWKLFSDENISLDVTKALRKLGYDVVVCPKGLKNGQLYQKIISEQRILLTHDKDFLDSGKYSASKTAGIIFIPIHPTTDKNVIPAIKHMLAASSPEKISHKLVILTKEGFTIESSLDET